MLALAVIGTALGQTQLFFDDFESSSGWTLVGEFEINAPTGLGGEHGNPDPTAAFSGSNVLGDDLTGLGANPGDYEASIADRTDRAESPTINCTGFVNITLNFQRWLNVESPSYDHAYIDVSNDNGANWTEVWANTAGITDAAWGTNSVDISAVADNQAQVKVRFCVGATDGSWFYSAWNLDDVEVTGTTAPSCLAPSTQTETNITATSADLGWTEIGSATTWEIEWGPTGFTQGTGTVVSTSSNPHNLGGLSPVTTYDWYVRADCGGGSYSTWTGASTFTTACATFTAPFTEDFENGGALPNCWTNSSSTGELWQFSTTSIGHSAPADHTTGTGYFAAVDDSESPHSTDVTLTTPFIDVSGLAVPWLFFWFYSDNEGFTNMTLRINVWDGAAWNNDLATFSGNTGDPVAWQEFNVGLTSLTITGPIQIQFVGDETSSGTGFYDDISIDDISVVEGPTTPTITVTPAGPFNFNYLQIGSTASQTFTVTNTGGGVGNITGASISGDAEFTIASTTGIPGNLPPDLIEVVVDFDPAAIGSYTATLTITDAGGTTDVLLSGEGVAAIANDDCADAQYVGSGGYPETVTGTTKGATLDCPGVLDWNAVWYEIDLPYAFNELTISYCGTTMSTGGIVYIPDCSSCGSYVLADTYAFSACTDPDPAALQMTFNQIAGPGTIMFPAYAAAADGLGVDITITFDVTLVIPVISCGNTDLGTLTPTTSWQSAAYLLGDTYYWDFAGTAGNIYSFSSCTAGEDTYIRIYDAAAILIASNDDDGPHCAGSTASIDWTCTTSGTYTVSLARFSCNPLDNDGNFEYMYTALPATASWAGTTDNDWHTASNWDVAAVPGFVTDVTIPTGLSKYPTLSAAGSCNDLEVQSDAVGDASLLGDGNLTVNGNATVQRYVSGGEWHDVSASTQGQTLNSIYFGGTPNVWLTHYNESDNTRTYLTNRNDPMDPGAGFEIWVESGNNVIIDYTGALQTANVTLTTASTPPIDYSGPNPQGHNLIGNPFASPIDLDLGTWSLTDVSTSFWVWDPAAGSYKDYNTSGSTGSLTDGIVPMGQGFFCQTTGATASITIPTAARVHSAQAFYKNAAANENPQHMSLRALHGNVYDEMNIVFHPEASGTFETFDTRKMFAIDGNTPQLYSEQNGEQLSINGLPLLTEDGYSVKVGYKVGVNGEQILEANLEKLPETEVFLEDLVSGDLQSLVEQPRYVFDASIGDDADRFILHFNPLTIGIGDTENENLVFVYAFDKKLYIKSSGNAAKEDKQIWVYDMMGRTAIQAKAEASTLTSIPVHHLNGYVIVKVMSESGVETTKVFIK